MARPPAAKATDLIAQIQSEVGKIDKANADIADAKRNLVKLVAAYNKKGLGITLTIDAIGGSSPAPVSPPATKSGKPRKKADWSCHKCGQKFSGGVTLGRHYKEHPDHKTPKE